MITNVNLKLKIIISGTREQAFVYALAASSFFYNLARKCASHDSTLKCGCGGFIHTDNDTTAKSVWKFYLFYFFYLESNFYCLTGKRM